MENANFTTFVDACTVRAAYQTCPTAGGPAEAGTTNERAGGKVGPIGMTG
jgi:hypothetical protein